MAKKPGLGKVVRYGRRAVGDRPGVVFLRIPKTASSSVVCAFFDRETAAGWKGERTKKPLVELFPNDFIFTVVRNPWDRLLSCYIDKVLARPELLPSFPSAMKKGMPFDEFVRIVADTPDRRADVHFRSQSAFFAPGGTLSVNFLVRFERLAEGWSIVRSVAAERAIPVRERLPVVQRRDRAAYAVRYTDTLADLVAERYRRDIRLLGYIFDDEAAAQHPKSVD